MPRGPVPESYRDILESTTMAHLATIDRHGHPQVNPIWFLWDGERVTFSVLADTVKYKNMRANPHVALSFLDSGNPGRYVEIRGEVISFELYLDLSFVNQLARKYTGADFTYGRAGQERYKITVTPISWTAQS